VLKLAQGEEEFERRAAQLRLREMRGGLPSQLDSLRVEFLSQIEDLKFTGSYAAKDAAGAADYIEELVDQEEVLAINRAGVIGELRPSLEAKGHHLVHTYLSEYMEGEEREMILHHHWQFPEVSSDSAYQSFNVQRREAPNGRKGYTALLGVSAASAEDGSLIFLQHTANISKMLNEAKKLILIVGIDKLVRTRSEAIFQARSMGALGLENVLLNLSLPDPDERVREFDKRPLEDIEAQIHVILLDNGRSDLADRGELAQLLTCISCQACAIQCPTYKHFDDSLAKTPKQYLWSYLLGLHSSLAMCIGCGLCHSQCPLDIDLPRLITIVRNERMTGWINQSSNRILHDAWWVMHGAHLSAPVTNGLLKNRLARKAIERVTGFEHDAWVPSVNRRMFTDWFRSRKKQRMKG
jgi:L-lactate utilization protein LutB